MPDQDPSLSAWLAGAPAPAEPGSPERARWDRMLNDLLDLAPGVWPEEFASAFDDGVPYDEARLRALGTIQHFVDSKQLFGATSVAYRRLAALVLADDLDISPETISECIAAYRLVCGRDPDESGFLTFARRRADEPLVRCVEPLCASAEATAHHQPYDPPPADQVALLATAMGVTIVHAAAGDVLLGHALRVRERATEISRRLTSIERSLAVLTEYVMLRLDGRVEP